MKHTKVKWLFDHDEDDVHAWDDDETFVGKVRPDDGIGDAVAFAFGEDAGEAIENAKLISKAPEMYEILKSIDKDYSIALLPIHRKEIQSLLKEIES